MIVEAFPYIEPPKTHVIYNGIKESYYKDIGQVQPRENRFIHASTWYRGLENFAYIWPRILERIPDAELHVFSKTSLYSELLPSDDGWISIAEELSQIPGMILREPVPQWILIREMRKAWLMLYPNSGFVESSCGSALQSISAGTPVIATNRAGLPETICNAGILIDEMEGWKDQFVERTLELAWKKERRARLSRMGREKAESHYWHRKAGEWREFLRCL